MNNLAIKVEDVSKAYQIGQIGTGTISRDIERLWKMKIRGKEDPFLKIGEVNDRSVKGASDIVWSLKDVNFQINQGDAVGIIGKNGAGKSTLLKLLSRVTGPTTGQIKVKGRIASLLEVGTGFHPELSGRENIYLNGAILGMRKKEITRKLDEIVDFSGVERYLDTPVKRYSSGMYVRLAFAVAAHLESEILIVDEVLAVGDAEFQKKCLGKMGDISKGQGRTVLFVSHNMAAVKTLCTKGIVLEHGKNVFAGDQHEAVEYYLQSDVRHQATNLLDVTNRLGNGKLRISKVELLNQSMEQISSVISGTPLFIKVSVKKNAEIDFKRLKVAINFQDANDNFILSFINDEMDFSFVGLQFQDHFMLRIPNLYLRSASYSLRILISEIDTSPSNFLDVIDRVIEVNVLPGDIWNTGQLNRNGSAAILPAQFVV